LVLTPEPPLDELEPLLLPDVLPEAGAPVVLLGDIVEPPVEPDFVPDASAPSPEAAYVAKEAADNKPASIREEILRLIMVRLQK
jgi:hypothetical protein